MDKKDWIKRLESEGFSELRVCPIESGVDLGEHTHDHHTVHVILSGELIVTDKSSENFFLRDRVEFPAGTTHKAQSGVRVVGCLWV